MKTAVALFDDCNFMYDEKYHLKLINDAVNLSNEEQSHLTNQHSRLVSEFKAEQLEKNSRKFWDLFYKRNENRFFKDRHWSVREFNELINFSDKRKTLLELGCGTGNFIYPLLLQSNNYFVYACDFSTRAINLVKSHELYDEERIKAFVADITEQNAFDAIPPESVDIVTLIFVLSAIHPRHYDQILLAFHKVLKPGGLVLMRDYGLHDMTQLRFKPGSKIFDNFYTRQDGTRSFFFSIEFVKELFSRNRYNEIETTYVRTRTVNKKDNVDVPRTFIQAKYVK